MLTGTYTALITPLTAEGQLDEQGLEQLIAFQLDGHISGLVPTGTTGECPTLTEAERRMERLAQAALQGDWAEAERLDRALAPLARIVHVETTEQTPLGPVRCRARSPLPVKTLMRLLGMPAGPCRAPLGRMTHLGVDIEARLADETLRETLCYPHYCELTI